MVFSLSTYGLQMVLASEISKLTEILDVGLWAFALFWAMTGDIFYYMHYQWEFYITITQKEVHWDFLHLREFLLRWQTKVAGPPELFFIVTIDKYVNDDVITFALVYI